ncbi:hypothetical protein K502DRAFT_345558 [Neoconidiobolus thromboides FSU 785]|nr:hypothetical protein K502DRAFT_345558 [Neoconidiobolus thromboides FSU 785]
MAQGNKLKNIKKKEKKVSATPKKGAKVIPPKKQQLIKQRKLTKKLTGVVNNKVETAFATKANSQGRLTMMKGLVNKAIKDTIGDKKMAPSVASTMASKKASEKKK